MNMAVSMSLNNSNISRNASDTSQAAEPEYTVKNLSNNPRHIFGDEVHLYVLPKVFENICENNELEELEKLKLVMNIDEEAISNEIDDYFGQFNGQTIKLSGDELASILQKILIKNTKYIVSGITDTTYNNLLIEIGSAIVDNCIIRFSTIQTGIMYIDNRYKKTQNVQKYIDLSKKLLLNQKLISQMDHTLLKVFKWYYYVLSHKDINRHYYLTYAAQIINEKLFTSSMLSDVLDDINKVFTVNLCVSTRLAIEEIDLFERRRDGMTHLDYALALLMKYRWEIADYYDKNGGKKKEFTLSEYEEQLLRRLYIDRKLVCKVFKSIREITKDSEKYVDCDSFISNTLFWDASVPKIKDPSSFKYKNEPIDARLNKALEKHANSPDTARNYIMDRVELYKNLVFDYKKPVKGATGLQKVINLDRIISAKKATTRSVMAAAAFITGLITTATLLNRSTTPGLTAENPCSNSSMEDINGFA
ncbi:hypothetical protein NEPAR04_0742 [Nematocida parisii]|nr:hypothetical protein NEPAR08_0743 [Nematocida parisii]KAI5127618.1 hypothetical protein NEPAR03_1008 [Nematocida parisii]KAI5141171.1 hypothetical protein NEPAR04_0742 [Nematocida parisii]